jgi:MFS family permease
MLWATEWEQASLYKSLLNLILTMLISLSSYYLPAMLTNAGITSEKTKLMLNGINPALSFIGAITGARLTDKIGRRPLLLYTTVFASICFAIITGKVSPHLLEVEADLQTRQVHLSLLPTISPILPLPTQQSRLYLYLESCFHSAGHLFRACTFSLDIIYNNFAFIFLNGECKAGQKA